jgi:hypothetical protein
MYMAPKRPIQFKMMLSEDEQTMLKDLANDAGLTVSDYLRQYIREMGRSTPKAPKASKKAKKR